MQAPDKPGSKPYVDLMKILNDHFSLKPIIIAERFRFHKRNQEVGESFAQYVAVLKKPSKLCDCGTHALRNRFVCSLTNENIQRKLLIEAALPFQRAVNISMSMEAVARESQHLKTSMKVHPVSVFSPHRETNTFIVARQIIMNETITTESSNATAVKREAILPSSVEIKKAKDTKEKYETKMKPGKPSEKEKKRKNS